MIPLLFFNVQKNHSESVPLIYLLAFSVSSFGNCLFFFRNGSPFYLTPFTYQNSFPLKVVNTFSYMLHYFLKLSFPFSLCVFIYKIKFLTQICKNMYLQIKCKPLPTLGNTKK